MPGHSNNPGNDFSVRTTKKVTTIKSDTIHPTLISCALHVISELFRDDSPSHIQHRKTSIDLQQLQSRRDDVLIARLHSDHQLSLKAHHYRIDAEIDPTCPSCHQADHTLQYWLIECPAGDAI